MRTEIIFEKMRNSAEYGKMLDVTIKSTKHSGVLLFAKFLPAGMGVGAPAAAPLSFPWSLTVGLVLES